MWLVLTAMRRPITITVAVIRIASTNATLGGNIQELLDAPLRIGTGPTIYLRDVGTINDTTDIVVGYAHSRRKTHRVHR